MSLYLNACFACEENRTMCSEFSRTLKAYLPYRIVLRMHMTHRPSLPR